MTNGFPEEVEASVIDDDLMIPSSSFEIDMSGIQRDIAELTEAIDKAVSVYDDMAADPDVIGTMRFAETRRCERAVSSAIRRADELRRKLNRDYRAPLDTAKKRYDELMEPIIELHALYKQRRIALEEAQKNEKMRSVQSLYEDMASQIALPIEGQTEALVPFERIVGMFGAKWPNKSCSIDDIELELVDIVRGIAEGERTLNETDLTHEVEAKAVYWQTLDVDKAIERDRQLCAAEARQAALDAERAELAQLRQAASQPADSQERSVPDTAQAQPVATRTPRVMLIEGATDDECRQIGQFCKSLGVSGVFKGERFYHTVKHLT